MCPADDQPKWNSDEQLKLAPLTARSRPPCPAPSPVVRWKVEIRPAHGRERLADRRGLATGTYPDCIVRRPPPVANQPAIKQAGGVGGLCTSVGGPRLSLGSHFYFLTMMVGEWADQPAWRHEDAPTCNLGI
ncbi:predicted protein [Verticillium alfalfae VaMs.102]|uniref:Predicted protein n=1 Tax=Verticillium alfalfae (strain VaMs.102 / ATCC MYA-4576 / FGSC 10136) TaxID=526221 RepID=C9SM42_VERA1|nr:predicted protein [Verticillium alfalfae VaMs.102]EEY19857.1 predicted protein [Verticillium alfalfae VaMs.102]